MNGEKPALVALIPESREVKNLNFLHLREFLFGDVIILNQTKRLARSFLAIGPKYLITGRLNWSLNFYKNVFLRVSFVFWKCLTHFSYNSFWNFMHGSPAVQELLNRPNLTVEELLEEDGLLLELKTLNQKLLNL